MKFPNQITPQLLQDWICPDLSSYWKIGKIPNRDEFVLIALNGNQKWRFSLAEGYALRYFNGQFTTQQIQTLCQEELGNISPNFVTQLIQKLIDYHLLAVEDTSFVETQTPKGYHLKSGVHWLYHPEGYWILRNPVAGTHRGLLQKDIPILTFLQVSDRDKAIIDQLGTLPPEKLSNSQLRYLLQLLTATAMLEGTQPPKPRRGKFTPMQLLSFQVSLFNPDPWLTQHVNKLRFLWSRLFAFFLYLFLAFSIVVGLHQRLEILFHGQQLWQYQGATLIIPFALLAALVVTLHELGHAFTLKHYGGIVPEIGFLFMCLIPAAYTNTTDSYCLSRWQRILVVGAGILVQVTLAAVALWLWNLSTPGTWLHTSSYLLMVASLFTVAVNLNPLAKFDGYYLAVAVTGINNLRSRAFSFYTHLLTGKPIKETRRDRWILATYAPFSLAYIWFVFGFLLFRISDWILVNIPTTTFLLLLIWAIYFYFPSKK
ncbi:MAG TPA: hypothetical protein DDZ80_02260 [Cyanobacteria bacterium UBA8803]|nr:hypothetical protein [Cyanobacteria bacterium UBA9273]HBL57408.1 hypothetical protein [Cyanobacteria bacterium UBA8803]